MGLPVITTARNGASEIMADGVHGFVLDGPSDIKALAGAMSHLCDPAIQSQMRRACLKLRPNLAYETHLDRLLDIYTEVGKQKIS
jgi:glycosyltransferase involved in cell wall biosynthesis